MFKEFTQHSRLASLYVDLIVCSVNMTDVASSSSGARVVSASCHDADRPPNLIIDG
jgi:hypothetical protein